MDFCKEECQKKTPKTDLEHNGLIIIFFIKML